MMYVVLKSGNAEELVVVTSAGTIPTTKTDLQFSQHRRSAESEKDLICSVKSLRLLVDDFTLLVLNPEFKLPGI